MSIFRRMGGLALVAMVAAGPAALAADQRWDLAGVRTLDLRGVSGDIVVRGGQPSLELESDVHPRDAFDVTVDERGSALRVEENWSGNSSGTVKWTIYVSAGAPALEIRTASGSLESRGAELEIDFKTASGDIELEDVQLSGDSSFSTASGDFRLRAMTARDGVKFSTASGDIELDEVDVEEGASFSTASGDIVAEDVTGSLALSSASGDVIVRDASLRGEGKFSSASGDVELHLDAVPAEGFSASSASGDVFLDAGKLGGSYTLILTVDEERGRIETSFQVASQRTFRRDGRDFLEQTIERGSGGPEIRLSSHSGKVVVR